MFKKTAHSKSSDKLPTSTGEFTGFSEPSTVGSEKKLGYFLSQKKTDVCIKKKHQEIWTFFPVDFPSPKRRISSAFGKSLAPAPGHLMARGDPNDLYVWRSTPQKKTRPKFQSKQGSFGLLGSRDYEFHCYVLCMQHCFQIHLTHLKLWGKFRNSQTLYYTPLLYRRLTFSTWQPPCNSNWKRFFCIASWWLGNGAACRKILCCCTTQTSSLWPAVQMTAAGFAPRSIQARCKVKKPCGWYTLPQTDSSPLKIGRCNVLLGWPSFTGLC